MQKLLASLYILFFTTLPGFAQTVTIRYAESTEDFANPERGFYIPVQTKASNYSLLDTNQLAKFRKLTQQLHRARYKVNVSLLYRAYELDIFKEKPLSPEFLANLQKDFDAVRLTGLKMILRFAYTNTQHSGDCKDEYNICPPYGDAAPEVVFGHIRQLEPLLKKNADVIAVLQEGFVGIWGENYYTDYFGCPSLKPIDDAGWTKRNELLKLLLEALPKDRMVQVRTPQIKQRFLNGPRATVRSGGLSLTQAYIQNDNARIGFHNDCFLASADDYGTFYDYGNSVSKKDTANAILRDYFIKDSRFLAVGGETCDDAFSPQNDCAPAGHAEEEMAAMHYSYLNASYNNNVNNDWDSLGCMDNIKRKLGYRLILRQATLPAEILRGVGFEINVKIENAGYASPFNPRPVQLILRNKNTKKLITLEFKTSIQKWFAGVSELEQQFTLANAEKGEYDMFINMPDGYKSLQSNPWYSIRLANEGTWEAGSGFNSLNHVVVVK